MRLDDCLCPGDYAKNKKTIWCIWFEPGVEPCIYRHEHMMSDVHVGEQLSQPRPPAVHQLRRGVRTHHHSPARDYSTRLGSGGRSGHLDWHHHTRKWLGYGRCKRQLISPGERLEVGLIEIIPPHHSAGFPTLPPPTHTKSAAKQMVSSVLSYMSGRRDLLTSTMYRRRRSVVL